MSQVFLVLWIPSFDYSTWPTWYQAVTFFSGTIEAMINTQRKTKYRAKRTEYGGEVYDSKLEAGVAYQLDMRLRAGEIAAVERQYQVVCTPYTRDGSAVSSLSVRHKVDFRIKHLDDTYELIEAKGLELSDYRTRRRWLEAFWLPEHPDHTYTVIKDSGRGRGLMWSKK